MSTFSDAKDMEPQDVPSLDLSDNNASSPKALVERNLNRSQKRTRAVLGSNIQKNIRQTQDMYIFSAKLTAFPFTWEMVPDLPMTTREMLYGFIARVILLYIISSSHATSFPQFTKQLTEWAKRSLSVVLEALALDSTPFQWTILHVLELCEKQTEAGYGAKKESLERVSYPANPSDDVTRLPIDPDVETQEDTRDHLSLPFHKSQTLPLDLYEMLNPQPIKSSLMSDGHFSALQLTINNNFTSHIAEEMISNLLDLKTHLPNDLHYHPGSFLHINPGSSSPSTCRMSSALQTDLSSSSEQDVDPAISKVPLVRLRKPKINFIKKELNSLSEYLSPQETSNYTDYFFCESMENCLASYQGRLAQPPSALALVLRNIFMTCLLKGHSDARFIGIMFRVASALDICFEGLLLSVQIELARLTMVSASGIQKEATESTRQKRVRRLKVLGVAAGLGALTGLTVGLAAPAIAAGFGALGIAGMSGAVSFMSTTGGSATLASLFGAGTAGFSGWKYFRRVEKIKVFKFDKLQPVVLVMKPESCESASVTWKMALKTSQERLSLAQDCGPSRDLIHLDVASVAYPHPSFKKRNKNTSLHLYYVKYPMPLSIVICTSGWLRHLSDIWKPWRCLCCCHSEVYALRWDPGILLDLGTFMLNILSQRFAVTATNLWLQTTVASALSLALMWPITLIQYASQLDNTWMVCRERSTQAGRLLAEAIADEKVVGSRPISLIGFSMGARVIYSCLQELHRLNVFHRVQDAILIGSPISCDRVSWQRCREVVTGRLVNVYSPADWLLAFLYRYMEWAITVAGLSAVKVEGVENYNVTGIITSHGQYADKIQEILTYIGYDGVEYYKQPIMVDKEEENDFSWDNADEPLNEVYDGIILRKNDPDHSLR